MGDQSQHVCSTKILLQAESFTEAVNFMSRSGAGRSQSQSDSVPFSFIEASAKGHD
jgi:hypothetical protein